MYKIAIICFLTFIGPVFSTIKFSGMSFAGIVEHLQIHYLFLLYFFILSMPAAVILVNRSDEIAERGWKSIIFPFLNYVFLMASQCGFLFPLIYH